MTATAVDASKVSAASNSSDDAVLSASDVEMDAVPVKAADDGNKAAVAPSVATKKTGCFGRRKRDDSADADAAPPRKVFNRPEPPSWLKRPFANLAFEWFTPLLWNGVKQRVEYDDLFKLPANLKAGANYPKFEEIYSEKYAQAEATEKGRAMIERAKLGNNCRVLLRTIVARHKWSFLGAMLLQTIATGLTFVNVVLLNQLLGYMQSVFTGQPGISEASAYVIVGMMFLNPMINSLLVSHSNRFALGAQVRIRADLASALYRKALRLSSEAKQQTEIGKVVNLMSADITQIMTFCFPFLSQLLTAPLTIIGASIFMITQISWATFIGLAILCLTTPVSGKMVTTISKLRREMLKYTDKRVKLMNQLLVGIRVIKMYAWEKPQTQAITTTRGSELHQLGKMIPVRVAMQTMLFAAPTVAAVCSFLAYGAANPDAFTVRAIFTSIALFNLMRFPLIMLPFALVQLANAVVSMRRISQFLTLGERHETAEPMDEPGIRVEDAHFYWAHARGDAADAKDKEDAAKKELKKMYAKERRASRMASLKRRLSRRRSDAAVQDDDEEEAEGAAVDVDAMREGGNAGAAANKGGDAGAGTGTGQADAAAAAAEAAAATAPPPPIDDDAPGGMDAAGRFHLQGVSLEVPKGALVCVVGRVGSGKSSLISAILGEMERHRGRVFLGGTMAYAAQQAWIMNDTLQNNVLFGSPFDEDRWERCLDACALAADLEILPGGAQTEIGEKGINLSGGQKQRVSLARAAYQDADVYVFDDPLSAVDVHVGKHIFTQCMQGMLARKTRLLVTNQLQYLAYADRVVFMDNGTIGAQGTVEECMQHEGFARMMAEFNAKAGEDDGSGDDAPAPADPMFDDLDRADGKGGQGRQRAVLQRQETRMLRADVASDMGFMAGRGAAFSRSTSHNFTVSTSVADAAEPRRRTTSTQADATPTPTRALASQPSAASGAPDPVYEDEPTPFESSDAKAPDFGAAAVKSFKGSRPPSTKGSLSSLPSNINGIEAAKRVFAAEKKALEGPVDGKALAAKDNADKGKLIQREDQEAGQVAGKVYWHYIKAFHVLAFVLLLVLWSVEQSLRVLQAWWLSRWTTTETVNQALRSQGVDASTDLGLYMGVYVGFCAAYVTFTLFRTTNNLLAALRASRQVHEQSLMRLVRAPLSFFDTTPVGRILNRYSKDTDDMDYNLPQSISEFGNCIFQLLATIIFICIVQYWFIIGIVPLLCLYYMFQHYYRKSYIEMQRLDAVSRSPLYAHFSETLAGVETIRAYGAVQRFADSNQGKVDYNHRAYFNQRIGDEWLSIRLDLVGASITFMAALLAVINRESRAAGILALTLTESLEVTAFLKYAVRAAAMFESRFNSVERLLAYVHLQQEAPAHVPNHTPPDAWPDEGAIEYRDISMRYRATLDPVLQRVSFRVAPGDKVGIVGRTGSGKSSLIVTLFRLVEPYEGAIMLDGVDLLQMGLTDLRSRLAAIPQDPVLFSGSLRSNLDPYGGHTDAELWDALEQVALKDVVSGLPGGLDGHVSENGDNFSVGQRQLLCVARALLRKPRVLVADEATASVDGETDSLIQRTIRTRFADCTVLTIAHRLNTILDSTKVLVMDAGRVKEYDTVKRLLSRQDSQFRSMVSEAGLLSEQASAVIVEEREDDGK